ncbi:unnamed protein product, partial [Gadus morhua 'NCC']
MRPSSAGSLPVDRLSSSPPSLHLLHLLLLLLLVPPSLSIQTERAESHDEFSCEPIGLRMCQDLPYNTTFMPNLLNHYDQQTAALAMEPFHPMVNLQCSPDMRMFLCALYAPVCTEYGRVSLPCRGLCRRSQSDCRGLMEMFGLAWPDEMDCSRKHPRVTGPAGPALIQPAVQNPRVPPPTRWCAPQVPGVRGGLPRQEDLLTTSDDAADQASMTVQRDYGFCRQELSAARYGHRGRLHRLPVATLFTFLTFLIDVTRVLQAVPGHRTHPYLLIKRTGSEPVGVLGPVRPSCSFRYPESQIIFYAVCYVMVSLVFFLGFLLEDRVACNAASPAHFRAATITQGSHNKVRL